MHFHSNFSALQVHHQPTASLPFLPGVSLPGEGSQVLPLNQVLWNTLKTQMLCHVRMLPGEVNEVISSQGVNFKFLHTPLSSSQDFWTTTEKTEKPWSSTSPDHTKQILCQASRGSKIPPPELNRQKPPFPSSVYVANTNFLNASQE